MKSCALAILAASMTCSDVVVERVVEEDGLLVDVTDELAQVVDTDILDVLAVDEHLAARHVVIARNEIDERRFTRARLSHEGDGLALRHREVDVLQHLATLDIVERNILQLHLVLKVLQGLGILQFLDGVLGLQDIVDAVHGTQTDGDVIGGTCQVLDGVDDAVEDDHIEDEGGGIDEAVAAQDEPAAEEHHDDDDDGTHGL